MSREEAIVPADTMIRRTAMKRLTSFLLIMMVALMAVGCGAKFEPEETAIYITSKGEVRSAVIESFEESYYDLEELRSDLEKSIDDYCLDQGESCITLETLEINEETGNAELWMEYETVEDYGAFNNVLLFHGTVAEAKEEGYFEDTYFEDTELLDTDGDYAELSEEDDEYQVIISDEAICIQTSGKILYVSDNVSIEGKKLAKAFETSAEHPAYVIYRK